MSELSSTPLINAATLQAYYKAENANDTTANARNLTNNGTTPFNAAKYNNGFDLGASNTTKYMSILNNMGVTGGPITMCGWVKLQTEVAGVGNSYRFFSQSSTTNNAAYNLDYQYNSGTPRLAFSRTKLGTGTVQTTYNITMGTTNWYHIAITYDGTSIRGYVNGAEVAITTDSGNGASGGTDTGTIGATNGGTGKASAIIDDVAYFSKALNSDEIAMLATDGSFVPGFSGANF